MKLATRDIPGFLQKPPSGVRAILLYGPDHGLIQQRGKQLAQTFLGAGYDPHSLTDLAEDKLRGDPSLLRDELSALGLLATGKRVVLLREAGDKLAGVIEDAFDGLHADSATLLVLSEDLGPSSSLRQLFEKHKEFAALPCYRDDGRTLEAVIAERLRTGGVQTSSDVIRFIAAHEGADRQVTLAEIDKMILYLGEEKRLDMDTAAKLAGQNNYLSQEDLAGALADGTIPQLQSCLARHLSEGVFPVTLVRGLQRYFQRLLFLHGALAQGESLDNAIAKLRPPVFFKYVPSLKTHMRRWSAGDVQEALSRLLECERALKSGALPPGLQLSHALMEIAVLPSTRKAA